MSEFREIVTKAVVSKGKKEMIFKHQIKPTEKPYSILGCWIINHSFNARSIVDGVTLYGEFEVDLWASFKENTKTEVIKDKIKYQKEIKTKKIVNEFLNDSEEILVKVLQHPSATSVKINKDVIELDIMTEMLVEVIGETKMQVTVFNPVQSNYDDIDDIDMDINEDFLNKK